MKCVDVIGIGAINYDYIFHCKRSNTNDMCPDSGREDIGRPEKDIEEEIQELHSGGKAAINQIGGSAFLTLKAIKYIDETLSISYVSVCGQLSNLEGRYGAITSVEDELDFIDNQEWLFYTDNDTPANKRYIGKSVVRLHRNVRDNIKISVGANSLLTDLIEEKERTEHVSFVDFLAQAKWIHISSLSTFEQFEKVMSYVISAKEKNRFLRISIDPGFQYTSEKKNELRQYLKIADYIFLSKREYENLVVNMDMPSNEKHIKLASYFSGYKEMDIQNSESQAVNTHVFIIKYPGRHELIDFMNGTPYVHYHTKLSAFRIYNDTGAGDCFAGGFIAGLLSNSFATLQPIAIDLGVLAARVRMETPKNSEVFDNIKKEAKSFREKKFKNGRDSLKHRVGFLLKTHYQAVLSFFIGAIMSFIISAICSMLF